MELQSEVTAISWVSNAAPPGSWDKGCPFNSLTFKNVYWKIISYKTGILNSSSYLQDTILLELYLIIILIS